MSTPTSQQTQKTAPAEPRKVFVWMLALTCGFYLVDCIVVALFQDHSDTPWIEWGVHASGPLGFGATLITFVLGIFIWLKEVAKQATEERSASRKNNAP
jgi:uncharacterized membrane protein (DUF485 family)